MLLLQVSYIAFIVLYAYVITMYFPKFDSNATLGGLSVVEIILYFWIFTIILEEIRQVGVHTVLCCYFVGVHTVLCCFPVGVYTVLCCYSVGVHTVLCCYSVGVHTVLCCFPVGVYTVLCCYSVGVHYNTLLFSH